MSKIYIFGHKNPDTDSVCSSISLSYLKNQKGYETTPRVLGNINNETKFVLKRFGFSQPEYLNNVKVQVRDMNYDRGIMVNEKVSITDAFNYMQEKSLTALPLVNEKQKLTGFVTLKEIALQMMYGDYDELESSYDNILKTLNGKEILKYNEEIKGNILVSSYQTQTFIDEINLDKNAILIVGDRYKVLEYAIKSRVGLIVITGSHEIPEELYKLAQENQVNIITTPLNTYHTSLKITQSNYINTITINKAPSTINELEFRTDFLELGARTGHTNYPVVNNKGQCLGLLRITSASSFHKKQVILVDHNNLEQSIMGIDEAEILEIIDHHNLGAIGTSVPINFRSMTVGCTSTILYYMYKEERIPIPKNIAGLMVSAILSDTMILKSPTTTEKDCIAAKALATIAGVDWEEYGIEMIKAGSSIKGLTIDDVIFQDLKSYTIGHTLLGISQVMTLDFEEIKKDMNKYIERLNEIAKGQYDVFVIFITDVIKNGSYMIYNTDSENILQDSYNLDEIYEGIYLDRMVSRKKQMLPSLMDTLEKWN